MNSIAKYRRFFLPVSNLTRNFSVTLEKTNVPKSISDYSAIENSSHIVDDTNSNSELPDTSALFPYYVENGLRKVYPYNYRYSTFCKGRWLKKNIIDCYHNEFALYPREEYVRRVSNGLLRVNGEKVGVDYVLQNADYITSVIHKHELAVLATPINIIYEDDDILVIDKPPSLPVHPCALYRYNTIIHILCIEYDYQNLYVIHRLDRLTSGVLIFAKTSEKSSELHKQMNLRDVKKEYICRVEGNFPDGVVTCNRPIKQIYSKVGVNIVHPAGKTCITQFQKLSFNGKSSVVLCKPHTGRTHQIRVHLQYLGHPIVNDPLYNSYVFGPEKGKDGILNKSVEQLMEDLVKEHSSQWWLENEPVKPIPCSEYEEELIDVVAKTYLSNLNGHLASDKYKKDPSRFVYDKDCHFCQKKFRDPRQTHLLMLLHAYKYEGDKWKFQTKMPFWASEDWCAS